MIISAKYKQIIAMYKDVTYILAEAIKGFEDKFTNLFPDEVGTQLTFFVAPHREMIFRKHNLGLALRDAYRNMYFQKRTRNPRTTREMQTNKQKLNNCKQTPCSDNHSKMDRR